MKIFKQMKPFYWNERKRLIISILSLSCATGLNLVYTKLLQFLIDDVLVNEKYGLVLTFSFTAAGVIIAKSGMQYLYGFTGARVGNKMVLRLRNACYEKLQYLPYSYYETAKTGDLIARMTVDMDAVRNFIGFDFAQFINMGLTIIFGTVMMLTISWKLVLLTLITTPTLIWLTFRLDQKVQSAYRDTRSAMSQLSSMAQENIAGIRTVKSFNSMGHETNKFSDKNEQYRNKQYEVAKTVAKHYPVIELMANICPILLLIFGGMHVIRGSLSLGELAALFSLIWFIISPMWWIAFHINKYSQAKASGERIFELLQLETSRCIPERTRGGAVIPINGEICFQNVSFYYEGNSSTPALLDFSLVASPGSVVGIIGSTGSGKSTILKLLIGAYKIKKGEITIDGKNYDEWYSNDMKKSIAPVFQETYLFAATIRDNIAFGVDNPSDEEIIQSALKVQAHEFISMLPMGYDTVIGERGIGLSGGQRQRIAIARALIRKPKILILDDVTSALDMETEYKLQHALKDELAQTTCFIMANRISSIRYADEIIVLDKGRILQRGTHQNLVSLEGPYRSIYLSQYDDSIHKHNNLTLTVDGGD